MPLPTRYWKIELSHITDLSFPPLGVPFGAQAIIVASIDGTRLGRSALLARNSDSFSFDGDDGRWYRQALFRDPDFDVEVPLLVEVYSQVALTAPVRRYERTFVLDVHHGALASTEATLSLNGHGTLYYTVVSSYVPVQIPLELLAPRQALEEEAVIDVPSAIVTQITTVRGLYQPGYQPHNVAAPKRAEYHAGYLSEDELGRIYLGRDRDGAWSANQERIELSATVTCVNRARPAMTMKWTILELPDPTLVTRLDMNERARTLLRDEENDEDDVDLWPELRWIEVDGYDIVETDEDSDWVTTTIVDGVSRVALACPSRAGECFRVLAVAAGDDLNDGTGGGLFVVNMNEEGAPALNVAGATGLMTMWHRVDVEYRSMTDAQALPVAEVAPYFEAACIQLDFAARTDCSVNTAYLADADADMETVTTAFTNEQFAHAGDGGWFCALAVREFLRPPENVNAGGNVYAAEWSLGHADEAYQGTFFDYVDLSPADSDAAGRAETATLEWRDGPASNVYFSKDFHLHEMVEARDEDWTRRYLYGVTVTKAFAGETMDGNNAEGNAVYYSATGHQEGDAWVEGGYEVPTGDYVNDLDALVYLRLGLPGDYTFSGWSPSLVHEEKLYFAGRTIVATLDQSFVTWNDLHTAYDVFDSANEDWVITLIHELAHGFGLPHRCAEWDHLPLREKSCVMNYSSDWMIDGHTPVRGSTEVVGRNFCGLHLRELRRVRLENNPALLAMWADEEEL